MYACMCVNFWESVISFYFVVASFIFGFFACLFHLFLFFVSAMLHTLGKLTLELCGGPRISASHSS